MTTAAFEPIGAGLELVVGGMYKYTPAAQKLRQDSFRLAKWPVNPPAPRLEPVIRPTERVPYIPIPDALPHRPGRGGPVGY